MGDEDMRRRLRPLGWLVLAGLAASCTRGDPAKVPTAPTAVEAPAEQIIAKEGATPGEAARPTAAPADAPKAAPADVPAAIPPGALNPHAAARTPSAVEAPPTIAREGPEPAPADAAALEATRDAAGALIDSSAGVMEQILGAGMPSPVQLEQLDRLRAIATFTRMKRRIAFRVVHAPKWGEMAKAVQGDLAEPDGFKRAALVRAALQAISAPEADGYLRATGYAFLRVAMKARLEAEPKSDLTADDPLRRVLIAEIGKAEADEERRYIVEVLADTPSQTMVPLLLALADEDPLPAIKRHALEGLNTAVRAGRLTVDGAVVRALFRYSLPEVGFESLTFLAGALKLDAVGTWCAGRISYSRACRESLAELETPAAFDALYPWVVAQEADLRSMQGRYYGFRDDFALLVRYNDEPFAEDRFWPFLERCLQKTARTGFATGFIVRGMGQYADVDRALALARTYQNVYRKAWTGKLASNQKFLMTEFEKTIAALEARKAGRASPQ